MVGRDPDDLVPLLHDVAAAVVDNRGAKAAVDVALHDLVARRRGVSLPVLLGGSLLQVPTDVTVAAGEPDALAAAALERVADGFDVLKLKVGTDAADDVQRVLAVRGAVGPATTLRLDANQGWTPREAVRVLARLADAGADIELVEQPVAAADLAGLAWVRDRVDTPVMADEAVCGVRDLIEVIDRGAADLVNVKLVKAGGLLPARTLLELARAYGLGTMVGSMMEGPGRRGGRRQPGRRVRHHRGARPGRRLVAGRAPAARRARLRRGRGAPARLARSGRLPAVTALVGARPARRSRRHGALGLGRRAPTAPRGWPGSPPCCIRRPARSSCRS